MSSRDSSSSRSSSSSRARAGGPGPKVRSDGKVDVSCPQCGARYRVAGDNLDAKIECGECHRTFFAKTAAGKRGKPPDNSKTYLLFGGIGLVVLISFIAMSGGGGAPPKKPEVVREEKPIFTVGTHPRTAMVVAWAQAMASGNRLVINTHNDLAALGRTLEVGGADLDAICAAIKSHESTKFLRELECSSGTLADETMMSAANGRATVYLLPRPGDANYRQKARCEIEVAFTMDGDQLKVTGWKTTVPPIRATPDPSKATFIPNKDIAASKEVEITDSLGTRKVRESPPGPVPHWDKASPELRAKADQVVADVIRSADHDAPGNLFNRATMSVKTLDERKAVVPRALNAMYELYADVNANYLKLSQLDRALRGWTGGAHNFELAGTGDDAKDKALRESCVRQWFAFWWRYSSGDLSDFIDMRENLDEPLPDPKAGKDPKKTDKK